jgi:hypothetical protein
MIPKFHHSNWGEAPDLFLYQIASPLSIPAHWHGNVRVILKAPMIRHPDEIKATKISLGRQIHTDFF